jgi:homoserine kinase type II
VADNGAVLKALVDAYGLAGVRLERVLSGVATVNYVANLDGGGRAFVKVYPPGTDLAKERAAIELSEFAAAGGVPTAVVVRSSWGEAIHEDGQVAMSVWEHVVADPGEDAGLSQVQMTAVGTIVGRLHRVLSTHPASAPGRLMGPLCDVAAATRKIDRVFRVLASGAGLDEEFSAWALDVLHARRELMPRVSAMLQQLPPLTSQVVHGDLAAPNVLFQGGHVMAVIDFRPPSVRAVAWEMSRLACDPRTVLRGEEWVRGLRGLVAAYRDENPDLPTDDLVGSVRAWVCYSAASIYPFDDLVDGRALLPVPLQRYAIDRHHALTAVMDRLEEIESSLREVVAS